MLSSDPALASNDASPIRPVFQLSSMNRVIEDWSVVALSTKFDFANGETTSSGSRGPYPQRPWYPPAGWLVPQVLGPDRASAEVWESLTMGDIWWSYQPSESSYAITTAVLLQSDDFSSRLIVSTRNCCSSSGLEYPAWPS